MSGRHLVRLIVCGSIDREDDAAAVWASEMLLEQRPQLRRFVDLVRSEQLDIDTLLAADPRQPVIVADAAVGATPGTIVVRSLADLADEPSGALPSSSHTLPVSHVLGIAAALGADLTRGTFVGLAGAQFGYGRQLSPVVRDALPVFVRELSRAATEQMAATVREGATGNVP
jgi:hydrogenase maturation protease